MMVPSEFIKTGSRRVLTGISEYSEKLETADYDFACIDSDQNVAWLVSNGFIKKPTQDSYMDNATTGIWELGNYQVTTKKPELWKVITTFWSIMESHPELFVDQIWKRGNGLTSCYGDHETITENINKWISILSVRENALVTINFEPLSIEELNLQPNFGV